MTFTSVTISSFYLLDLSAIFVTQCLFFTKFKTCKRCVLTSKIDWLFNAVTINVSINKVVI